MKTKLVKVNLKINHNFVVLVGEGLNNESESEAIFRLYLQDIVRESEYKISASEIKKESDIPKAYRDGAIPWSKNGVNPHDESVIDIFRNGMGNDMVTVLRFLYQNEKEIVEKHGEEEFFEAVKQAKDEKISIKQLKDRLRIK